MKIKKVVSCISITLLTIIFISIISVAIIVSAIAVYITNSIKDAEVIDINATQNSHASAIYSLNPESGLYQKIYETPAQTSDMRYNIKLSDLPGYVAAAFICTEDERFYEHSGIDYKRTLAAFVNEFANIYGSTQGGSTITQQLVKNITNDNEPTWERKVREISRAIKLEKRYTKDDILNAYLNTIYFGQDKNGKNMYGIEAASIGYFGKSASELTISEAASLAAIPQNPYYDNPINNYESNQSRKNYVLEKLFELGKISASQYETSINESVLVSAQADCTKVSAPVNTEIPQKECTSWIIDTVIYEFRDFFSEKSGYRPEDALNEFYNGGYDIYITADTNIQNELEKNYADLTYFPKATNSEGENVQSAFVVIDYHGQILGIVGGIGEKTSSLCWNNATMTHRQPGSTIKPLSVYGYGIESGLITWSSVFIDSPLQQESEQKNPWPENYDNYWSYKANTVNFFLKKSYNTVPAQLCQIFGPQNVYNFAVNCMHLDLNSMYDIDYAPLTVGATYSGPSLLNITNAYLPYGNGGKYYKAHIISSIKKTDTNETILDHTNSEYTQSVSPETAYIMNKMLQNVVDPSPSDGQPGTGATAYLDKKTVAGKTGTTQNWRDISFIGMTEDFVSGIWIGYPNSGNEEAIKNTKAATVWKNVFGNYANEVRSKAEYPVSNKIVQRYYCTETGLLANERCPCSKEPGYYREDYNVYCNVH